MAQVAQRCITVYITLVAIKAKPVRLHFYWWFAMYGLATLNYNICIQADRVHQTWPRLHNIA